MATELDQIGGRCGLPVSRRPEWGFARSDGSFSFEVEILGERIVVARAEGRADVEEAERTLALSTAVVDCFVPPPRTYVTIVDFRRFVGATPAAKSLFVRRITSRPRMECVVFCGLSPLLHLMVSMSRRLGHLSGRVMVARTFESAVAMACERLEGVGAGTGAAESGTVAVDSARGKLAGEGPPGAPRVERDPSWRVAGPEFEAEFEFHGARVLHARLKGRLRGEDVANLTALTDRILAEPGSARRLDYLIGDLTGLVGGAPDARRRYQEALQARDRRRQIKGCFVYGAKGRARAAISLAGFVLPFPLRAVSDLPAALRAIAELENREARPAAVARLRSGASPAATDEAPAPEVAEILRYLGEMRWDVTGAPELPATPRSPAATQVFEAINQIKWEFDELVAARQAALEESRRVGLQRRALVDLLPDGVALFDADGRMLLANPAAERLLPELSTLDARGRCTAIAGLALNELCRRGRQPEWHERELGGKPQRSLEIAGAELDEGLHVAMLRDVTRDRGLARELAGQERLAAVGQLAAGIAHDFNNILQVVISSAEFLADGAESENARELAETIQSQCERGARLIRQILDFGRRSVSRRRRVDLAPLLAETVELLRRTLPESIVLDLSVTGDSFPALVDPDQLQQAITNLSLNARDAMPSGGRLTFSLARRAVGGGEEPPIASMAEGDWLELDVADTGVGIEAGELERIFEPFYTTKPVGAGVGLGLSQVYGIVRQQDGHVRCNSRPGEGATFSLYFPALAAGETQPAASREPAPHRVDRTPVLLVEDDLAVRRTLCTALESLGYRVMIATNGLEALALVDRREEPVELVVSDVVMPEMGGVELAERLRERSPSLRVLLVSGYPLGDELRARRADPRIGWLSKPFSCVELSRAIEQLGAGPALRARTAADSPGSPINRARPGAGTP